VVRLLGGHYPSVVAHTGSFAAPVGLSPPSAFGLVRRVLAGCYQSLLPTAASRRYSENLYLDAGPHTPAVHRVLAPVSSTAPSAFPTEECGSASRVCPRMTTSRGVTFRGCRYSVMFRPPSLLAPRIVPTAAILPQGSWGFYIRAYRALLPPHAPDLLTARIQAIGGTRTCTSLDSQPCRLLRWDRDRARPAVGEGFPFPLFRLQDGFTVSPWRTFLDAPL
jgi:hypothetical protein